MNNILRDLAGNQCWICIDILISVKALKSYNKKLREVFRIQNVFRVPEV